MSPYETGDISLESERVATSGRDFIVNSPLTHAPFAGKHARILELARTRYAGFNDHHFCEKFCEVESLSIGRETLRRLLRSAGIGSPRKRRAPTDRQRRLPRPREGEMVLFDASVRR